MPVKIRLQRHGSKKKPFYRIVVATSEAKRDGRFIDIVGTYNPLTDPATITLKQDKIKDWLTKGAQTTETVRMILKKGGIPLSN